MTLVSQTPREQQQPDPNAVQHPEPAGRVDLARTDAHRVATLVQIARDGHSEARDSGDDAERLRHAADVLYDRIASKVGDRRTRLDRALHGIDGSLDEEALLEYLDLTGREGLTARKALQQILDRRTFPEFDGGLEISDRLHGLAHSWERDTRAHEAAAGVRPALPPAAAAPVADPLPHREPIAPALPPMYPAAPPELPAESTGTLLQRVRDNGHTVTPEQEAAARKDHQAPAFGPPVDPKFAAVALPGRIGDTVTMRADDVLAHLAADDASEVDDTTEPRPFGTAASTASPDAPQPRDASGSGDGDD